MATHAAMPARQRPQGVRARAPARHRHTAKVWAVPLTLGVLYGLYAAFIRRDGGPATGGVVVLGVVAGIVFAVLCFALARSQMAMPREARAAAYGALTSCAVGFLVSLTDTGVIRSAILGLVVGVPVGIAVFYFFYSREDWPATGAATRTGTGTGAGLGRQPRRDTGLDPDGTPARRQVRAEMEDLGEYGTGRPNDRR